MNFKDFIISRDEIIQPEKIKNLTDSQKFQHIRYHPNVFNKRFIFNHPKIYFELGDFSFTDEVFNRIYNNKVILATNNRVNNENVFSLPIGITSTSHCSIIGNIDIIVEQFKRKKLNKMAYINYKIKDNPLERAEREYVLNKFSNKHWVTNGNFERTHTGHKTFIEDIYDHKFVFCPRGNGVDTHRLWTSLYLGSIPIVRFEKEYEAFQHLPILFIKNWDEITLDFLEQKYEEIHSKKYDFSVLTMSYWKKICNNK